jgi:hypothetical protein
MKEKDGKRTFYYADENGEERAIEKHKTARTRMTAYLSDDDGKTFPHKYLLCDAGQISYPSAALGKNGAIYIVYDQGRGTIGQHTIFLSKMTEEDILAGKLVNGDSFLNRIVTGPCAIRSRRPRRDYDTRLRRGATRRNARSTVSGPLRQPGCNTLPCGCLFSRRDEARDLADRETKPQKVDFRPSYKTSTPGTNSSRVATGTGTGQSR